MLEAQRRWRRRACPDDTVAELQHDLGLNPLTARILAARGMIEPEEAQRFLAKRLSDLHRPQALTDMDKAATRFAEAINKRETILIHGDYDVDGSTSATLLSLFVRTCGHQAIAWIPHRRIDGYGLGEASLQAVKEQQASLMITVDCGIADDGWAARIESDTGCDVIITDHHLPQGSFPNCHAVVNPNRADCPYPDKGLAGVGVAWKLCWATACALCQSEKITDRLREFLLDNLALVAVGTVADCAPLAGENRALVHHGLKALARTSNPGLRALLEHTRLNDPISASDIGWKIGPLLNASGRLGSAMRNIHLLTAESTEDAQKWLDEIVAENEERRRLSHQLTEELMAEVAMNHDRYAKRVSLVFAGEGWHQGVVGIVASRLTERFAKPTAVIAIEDGLGKGSLRSIPDVHLGHALEACRDILEKGGGHAMAAGCAILPENVEAFIEAFDNAVRTQQPGGLKPPDIEHDGICNIAQLDDHFFADLDLLAPFGQGNPEPVLHLKGTRFVTRPQYFGKGGDHLRGALTDAGGGIQQLLAWRARDSYSELTAPGLTFNALVRPQLDYWRGEPRHQLILVDGASE